MISTGTRLGLFLGYLAFVVYGSLIPFELRETSFDAALERFSNIPWLDLGPGSRADWVANILLYIPLVFLGSGLLGSRQRNAAGRLIAVFLAIGFGIAVAIAVEFTQIFFAPRTVSLNDLLAETLGSIGGGLLWLFGRQRLHRLGQAFAAGGRPSVTAAITGYLLVYVVLALFPFDFAVSWSELAAKVDSGRFGWVMASVSFRGIASLVAEVVAIAPLGVLVGLLAQRIDLIRVFLVGLLLGLVLEFLQLLILSSVTQGLSAVARGVGLAAGVFVGHYVQKHGLVAVALWVRRLSLPLALPYLAVLAAVTGWFVNRTLGFSDGLARFELIQFVPFYFHYFTSEPAAMASLLANMVMYSPLGILAWAKHTNRPESQRRGVLDAVLPTLMTAAVFETSKLWLAGKHPDYTNLLIAVLGAAVAYLIARWIGRASLHADTAPPAPAPSTPTAPDQATARPARQSPHASARPRLTIRWPSPTTIAASALAAAALAAGLVSHPLTFPWVIPIVALYARAIWKKTSLWLLVLPAALPVLDFAPLAGRQLLDVFDLLVLATLAVGYWQLLDVPQQPWPGRLARVAVGLLLPSALISTMIGLAPVMNDAPLSLASSHPVLETLIVAKGLFWALALVPLLRRIPAADAPRARDYLLQGLALGAVLTAVVVAIERHRFVGLADFDNIFRVTGNFSAMNNGGAYIEAYLALAIPALIIWTLQQRWLLVRALGAAGVALSTYAMFVTFSRGGYGGLAVGLLVLGLGVFFARGREARRYRLGVAALGMVAALAATPILLGEFAQGRLAQIERDLEFRLGHWRHAIGLMDEGVTTKLFGMGFGTYPSTYLWRSDRTPPPGTFRVESDGNLQYLRLGTGDAYYLDQIPGLTPDQRYRVEARVRFEDGRDELQLALCEKALLYSFSCNWFELKGDASSPPGTWQMLTTSVDTQGLGETGRWPGPTLKLSLVYPRGDGAIDIERISLVDSNRDDLLRNGRFEKGLDHWLAATDRRLAWHMDQTQVEIYFAQGLLGLIAWILVFFAAVRYLVASFQRGDMAALSLLSGLAGFASVGLLGSTQDASVTGFIFYLVTTSVVTSSRPPIRD